jgi:hypothetical protein
MREHFAYHRGSLEAFALPWPSPIPGIGDPPGSLPEALRRALYALPIVGFVLLPLQRFGRPGRRGPAAAVWLLGLCAYGLAVRRPDPSHFVQALPVSLLPCLALRLPAPVAATLIGVGLLGLGAELSVDAGARRPNPTLALRDLEPVDLPRARGVRAPPGEAREIEAIVAEVTRRTAPGDRIAALPADALIPFLADRRPALRYDAVYPVLLDDPERAAVAAEDLAAARLVVLSGTAHGFAGPGSPGLPEYAPGLWRTLQERFHPAGQVGRFTLLEPREPALP